MSRRTTSADASPMLCTYSDRCAYSVLAQPPQAACVDCVSAERAGSVCSGAPAVPPSPGAVTEPVPLSRVVSASVLDRSGLSCTAASKSRLPNCSSRTADNATVPAVDDPGARMPRGASLLTYPRVRGGPVREARSRTAELLSTARAASRSASARRIVSVSPRVSLSVPVGLRLSGGAGRCKRGTKARAAARPVSSVIARAVVAG